MNWLISLNRTATGTTLAQSTLLESLKSLDGDLVSLYLSRVCHETVGSDPPAHVCVLLLGGLAPGCGPF